MQVEIYLTDTLALRAVWLVGNGENTTAPDPLHGSIPVVGSGWVPYWVNVTVGVAAALGVMNWAAIERPREPVSPADAVEGAGDDTATVCPPAGWPIWPRRGGPGHTTSTEALDC